MTKDSHNLAEKYGLPRQAITLSVPNDIASKPVTRGELITIIGSLQRFVVAASNVSLVSATNPDETDEAVEALYKSLAELRGLVMKLTEQDDG